MWVDIAILLKNFIDNSLLIYSVSLIISYITLGLISIYALRKYLQKNKNATYTDLLPSFIAPSVSLIAPAYNEGLTIVENIRSLMSLYYSNFEVIIINDGSKDDTLKKAIEAYQMEIIHLNINQEIPTKEIRNIYRSKLPAFKNLLLIDKINGGKADALNAGINIASGKYVACIDVDCILEQDAIIKLVKPFLDNKNRVIATGGVIRIVNSCEIKNGCITKIRMPKSWLASMQVLEYLRAFLLGRMAWGSIDGLLIISGAFGMFEKEIVKLAGGYDVTTVGEDMELVVKMRRYMVQNQLEYSVKYIPDPLCWTEAPENSSNLIRQRNRWLRGSIDSLWKHRVMFLNPKFGLVGLLSFPYYLLFELLAPVFELLGIAILLASIFFGLIDINVLIVSGIFIYSFIILSSLLAIYAEEITYCQYKNSRDILKLVVCAFFEPFLYHPILVYSAILGFKDYFQGNKSWGEMNRKGLKSVKL